MAKITVAINDKPFELACDEGQESQLRELAKFFDGHVAELRRKFGQVGETRLYIMAGLTIADQLADSLARIEAIEVELRELRRTGDEVRGDTLRIEEAAIRDIEHLAERLEGLAHSLHT